MWWMCLAALADPVERMEETLAAAEAFDTLIAEGAAWWAGLDAPDARSRGQQLSTDLRASSKDLRKRDQVLIAVRGQLEDGPKKVAKVRLPELEALTQRIHAQRRTARGVTHLVDAGLAMMDARDGDLLAYERLNNDLLAAVKYRPTDAEGPVDRMIAGPLALAVEQEQWKHVRSWATWCSAHCEDPAPAGVALEKIPEGQRASDSRWKDLEP